MARAFSFRAKIASPVILLVAGLIAVGVILIEDAYSRLKQSQGLSQSAVNIKIISDAIHEIQLERAKSVLFLNGKTDRKTLESQREKVNQIISLTGKIPVLAIGSVINAIRPIREQVDKGSTPSVVAKEYGDLVDAWIMLEVELARQFHLNGLETRLISIAIVEKSKESMGRLRAAVNAVLGSNAPVSSEMLSTLVTHRAGISANIDSPGNFISQEKRNVIRQLMGSQDWQNVMQTYNVVIEKSAIGQYGIAAADYSATITKVIDGIRKVVAEEVNDVIKETAAQEQQAMSVFIFSISGIICLTVISTMFSWLTVRTVSRSLANVTRTLTEGANAVAHISGRIAAASQDLSASARQQAVALQQTSSAIDETSAMVSKNAENAAQSSKISHSSEDAATNGKAAVGEMANSISAISESINDIVDEVEKSNIELAEIVKVVAEIGNKTKVINDIVFQTKLLSFNASVEAARAGEHGKGFSVVAEEIGNLARMSGSSAQEISQMLDASISKVENIVQNTGLRVAALVRSGQEKVSQGNRNSERCGQVLDHIVSHVSEVTSLVTAIAEASQEQAKGISEINKAILQLDTVAQQNTVASEDASSSGDELAKQVESLRSTVNSLNDVVYGRAS